MKIFAAADIHGSQYRLNIILNHIETHKPDLAVVCGDITQFGPGDVAKNFLDQIPIDALAIPGNIDTPEVGQAILDSSAKNIDKKLVVKNEIPFIGIGGEISSPPSEIFITENGVKKSVMEIVDKDCILVTHIPPYKTRDRVFLGHHIGSKELRKIVETCKPRLVLCGHVHEDPGISKIGNTTVVNCSIGKRTEGALIKINGKIDVKLFD